MIFGSRSLKQVAFTVLGSPLALRAQLDRIKESGALTILNLHRVDDHGGSAYAALSPAIFDDLLGWLCERFEILRFSDLERRAAVTKPALVLSFDDGYKDFIEVVVPILRKYRLQANQNIVPACIASGLPPMNVVLQDFIGTAPAALLREIELPGLASPLDPDDRSASGLRASAAFKNKPITEQQSIFAQLRTVFERFDGFRPTPMMTLDDIRAVAGEHEIGMHSWEHATMACESAEYVAGDAARCQAWYVDEIGIAPKVYAFPNGSTREGHAEIVRDAGFSCVLAVGEDFSYHDAWLHKRFTIYGSSLPEARFRAIGGFRKPRGARDRQVRERAA